MAASAQHLALIGAKVGEPGRALKYEAEMCDRIRDMAQQGMFPEEWCGPLGVTLETMRLWGHKHPEFRDALIISRHLLNAYWSAKARRSVDSPNINQTVLVTILKGRFNEFYGNNPANIWHFLHSEDGSWGPATADAPKGAGAGLNMQIGEEAEVQAKLALLRARREAEAKE